MSSERVGGFSNRWRGGGQALALAVMVSSFALLRCGGESSSENRDEGDAGSPAGGDTLGGSGGTGKSGTSTGGASGTSAGTGTGGVTGGAGGVTAGMGGVMAGAAGVTAGASGICSVVNPADPRTPVEMTLENFCVTFGCPASFDEAIESEQNRCMTAGPGFGFELRTGCGYRALGYSYGTYADGWWVFDATTGELIGAHQFSDGGLPPCMAFIYQAGVGLPECSTALSCSTCSNQIEPDLPCRYDCDCENTDINGDVCINPDSCGCYCLTLLGTQSGP